MASRAFVRGLWSVGCQILKNCLLRFCFLFKTKISVLRIMAKKSDFLFFAMFCITLTKIKRRCLYCLMSRKLASSF